MGLQTYPLLEDSTTEYGAVVMIMDNVVLSVFCIEAVLKIFGNGFAFWRYAPVCVQIKVCYAHARVPTSTRNPNDNRYFVDAEEWKWNDFDFVIVVVSIYFLFWGEGGSGSLKLLRLLRLARLGKLVKKVPQLQMIVMGLVPASTLRIKRDNTDSLHIPQRLSVS